MSDQIDRNTMQVHPSVNTPDYSIETFLNISGKTLPNCDKKYWKIVGEQVVEMTIDEKAVVDYVAPSPEPTPEELAAAATGMYKQNVRSKIEKTYSRTDELGIIREALAALLPDDVNVQAWNSIVLAAKAKYSKV